MAIVKVDVSKVKSFLLANGGFSEVDERNLQDTAELIREESGCSVIQFHRQKDFDFKYVIPSGYVHEDLTGKLEGFSSGGGFWHSVLWLADGNYYAICNEWDSTLMKFDYSVDRENGCEHGECGFFECVQELSADELESLPAEKEIFWKLHNALVKELADYGYDVDYFDILSDEEKALFCKEENPYTTAYKLAYDAYAWSSLEMWDILDECLIKGMITRAEAEMIAEDVTNVYNK